MQNPPYEYSKGPAHRDVFTSSAKRDIDKVVGVQIKNAKLIKF